MEQLLIKKKKRAANFTKHDTELLVDIVIKYQAIIENKKTDAATWKEKDLTWDKITFEFNEVSEIFPRTKKTVKSKYESLKKEIRKKCSILKTEQTKTGGGVSKCYELTPYEEKMLSIDQLSGLKPIFCSDSLSDPIRNRHVPENNIEYLDDNQTDPVTNEVYVENIDYLDDNEIDPIRIEKDVENVEYLGDEIDASDNYRAGLKKTNIRKKGGMKKAKKQSLVELKRQFLILQKNLLTTEIKGKSEINEWTIKNLKMDYQIKKIKLMRLRGLHDTSEDD